MAEKIGFGEDRSKTIIRTPRPEVKIIRWDWTNGRELDNFDVSHLLLNLQWQKTIKSPEAPLTITCVPQIGRTHLLDYIRPMDVVQVFEFGTLKYQGYIEHVDSTGEINPQDGKPTRMVSIVANSFGNLFLESEIGLNVYLARGTQSLVAAMTAFAGKLSDAILKDDSTFASVVKIIMDEWFIYLTDLKAEGFTKYLERFVDYETGLAGVKIPGYPRELRLFRAEDESMTLWSILQKVCEPPFNEIWFDTGPRTVQTEPNDSLSGQAKVTNLPSAKGDEKTFLVVRATPMNGTMVNGTETKLWDNIKPITIPLGYLTKFSLSKSMQESFSFYLVQPSSLNMQNLQLVALGAIEIDSDKFNKYLYRPMIQKQFFSRHFADGETEKDPNEATILQVAKDSAKTLMNWHKNNDELLSGSFTIMVPSNQEHDPRIGSKVEFEGMEGDYYYCEGVSHSWSYGGPITSTLSVTRGYNTANKPIELKDKIFRRGLFSMNRQFNNA